MFWIGSERGLFRFDGIRFERFEQPPGQTFPTDGAQFLLALPDTSLWIGHFSNGVTVIHRGTIVNYGTQDGLPRGTVASIARDSSGTMWTGTTRGLARLTGRRWEQVDTAFGYPGGFTGRVSVDASGSVWALGSDAYVLRRGAARFEKRDRPGTAVGWLVAAPDGSIWGGHDSTGVFPLADARGAPAPTGPVMYADTGIYDVVWARDHPAVALGTRDQLVRLSLPTSDNPAGSTGPFRPRVMTIPFSRSAGMSGSLVSAALYDREGSLWIGTPTGIDRFRATKLTPVALTEYLRAPAVAGDTNGSVWVAARQGRSAALLAIGARVVPRHDAPEMLTCIYRDLHGNLWIGGAGVWQRKANRFVPV
ncbi:MAG TPA: hypothetical protein VHJ83_15225, partial [Micromonosporaceae bacterium]|nr:hypothetical protein [Micromonosporaceae bacterium]